MENPVMENGFPQECNEDENRYYEVRTQGDCLLALARQKPGA
jgi:hypothetical protein